MQYVIYTCNSTYTKEMFIQLPSVCNNCIQSCIYSPDYQCYTTTCHSFRLQLISIVPHVYCTIPSMVLLFFFAIVLTGINLMVYRFDYFNEAVDKYQPLQYGNSLLTGQMLTWGRIINGKVMSSLLYIWSNNPSCIKMHVCKLRLWE